MLTTSDQDARQNGVGLGTRLGSVAAIGLADDDGWSDHPFGLVIGGIQPIDIQEPQQVRPMLAEPFGKAGILFVRQAALRGDQLVQLGFEGAGPLGEGEGIQVRLFGFQVQALLQQGGHLPGKVQRSPGFALAHLLQVLEQMPDAFLLQPIAQALLVIGQETIGSQDAFELLAQDIDHHVARAIRPDIVDRDRVIGKNPQPRRERSDPPTGLIHMDSSALADQLDQSFVDRSGRASQFAICAAPPAPANLQTEAVVQRFAHFGIGNAQPMFEIAGQGLRPRTDHHLPRRARGMRNLILMPRPHSSVAMAAIPAIGQIPRDERRHFWKINLKLLMLLPLAQLAATLWAAGQFSHLRFIHFFQARFGSLHKAPLSNFPSRPLRMFDPLPTRKWRGLPPPSLFQLFDLCLQNFHLLLQSLVLLLQQLILPLQDLIADQHLCQLCLHLRNPLLARLRRGGYVPALAHEISVQFSAYL